MAGLLDLLPPELLAQFGMRSGPGRPSNNVGQTMAASTAMSGGGGPPSLAAMAGGPPTDAAGMVAGMGGIQAGEPQWGLPPPPADRPRGGVDPAHPVEGEIGSELLGAGRSARAVGWPTQDRIRQSLPTSETDEGKKAADDYASTLFQDYYTPGGSHNTFGAGQAYAYANDIDYTGAHTDSRENDISGFTIGGVDPFAGEKPRYQNPIKDQYTGDQTPSAGIGYNFYKLPSSLQNVFGPAIVRNVMGTAPTRGMGLFYPGSVKYAPIGGKGPTPFGEGEYTQPMARDWWGRLVGGARGYDIS
jgi:hypothetical protein